MAYKYDGPRPSSEYPTCVCGMQDGRHGDDGKRDGCHGFRLRPLALAPGELYRAMYEKNIKRLVYDLHGIPRPWT